MCTCNRVPPAVELPTPSAIKDTHDNNIIHLVKGESVSFTVSLPFLSSSLSLFAAYSIFPFLSSISRTFKGIEMLKVRTCILAIML